ncbi:MAG: HAMP domain-containing histidine kinase [Pyrinomonadaceae bacterium]|nr:HAMP domain-containing histidine kinase [Pyrinomonadaceae bacterium]
MLEQASFRHTDNTIARYGLAVLAVLTALLITQLLWTWVEPHPTSLFLAAVTVSAWYGGLRPSLLATILAALAVDYFFIAPVYHLELSLDNTVRTSVFVLVALLISWVDAARKRAITERDEMLVREKEARRAAEAASRTKDEFLAMVTHELRTPLSVITGWAGILLKGDMNEEASKAALETIKRNAEIQRHLIDDLLDISRITSGRLRVDAKETDLVSVIEEAVAVVALSAQAKGIRLHAEYDWAAGSVIGDPERLQQVFWNLLSNAVKFTPDGGSIDVRLEHVDSSARITVSDTGKGIDAEFLPFVFDRFSQESGAASKRKGGLGLGLSIVRHLVELHGGTVKVESRGEGQGARFTVCLPLATVGDQTQTQTVEVESLQQTGDNELNKDSLILTADGRANIANTLWRS